MNADQLWNWKEPVAFYFKLLSRHSPDVNEKNNENPKSVQQITRPRFEPGTSLQRATLLQSAW